MAKLYITEYTQLALDSRGLPLQAGDETGWVADQVIDFTAGSTQSAALNTNTKFVRMSADAVCSVRFAANPTATVNNRRLPANTIEYVGVKGDVAGGLRVAAVANT